jgi:hypothetical protein
MSCSGQKRALVSTAPNSRAPSQPLNSSAVASSTQSHQAGDMKLRHLGHGALLMRGPRTGRVYYAGAGATIGVHPDDVEALLRTRVFVH